MLTKDDLAELRGLGRERRYRRGQRVLLEGDRNERVAVVHHGRVKITTAALTGQEIILAVRGVGDLLGEQSALMRTAAGASVVALEDVHLTSIGIDDFLSFLESRPELLLDVTRRLIERLRESDTKLLEVSTLDVSRRVARRLLTLALDADHTGDGIVISTQLTQEELAALCSASRESVARVFRDFRDSGLLRTTRRRFVILDVQGLEARA